MTDTVLRDKELSNSAYSHVINAPIEKGRYCGLAFQIAGGRIPSLLSAGPHLLRPTDDGTPMSINVEMIGKTLMIQHYVAEVATAALCRMSRSPTRSHPMAIPACR